VDGICVKINLTEMLMSETSQVKYYTDQKKKKKKPFVVNVNFLFGIHLKPHALGGDVPGLALK
jgi:hypothetical protein